MEELIPIVIQCILVLFILYGLLSYWKKHLTLSEYKHNLKSLLYAMLTVTVLLGGMVIWFNGIDKQAKKTKVSQIDKETSIEIIPEPQIVIFKNQDEGRNLQIEEIEYSMKEMHCQIELIRYQTEEMLHIIRERQLRYIEYLKNKLKPYCADNKGYITKKIIPENKRRKK